ncbi:MAG: hypothetical protein IKX00_04000 [Bacilli bacterium]|nr:hypothetical protein [Bacilli bacterium]
MKKILYILFLLIISITIVGCSDNKTVEKVSDTVKVFINDKEYKLNLYDNETSSSLVKLFPIEVTMKTLNENEVYVYLDEKLPTNSSNPKTIHSGDVMLYGDNCLVIFYKTFNTSYSYTKIGHIDNLPIINDDTVKVRIEKE